MSRDKAKGDLDTVTAFLNANAPSDVKESFFKFMVGTAGCLRWADRQIMAARLVAVGIGILYIIKCL